MFHETAKHAFLIIKPSSFIWHCRLGHPSSFVVQQVLRRNKIAYTPESTPYVCDSCQLAKSHQLPYPTSSSVSTTPLEQVFSDVWGPAPLSVGKQAYYVRLLMILANSHGFIFLKSVLMFIKPFSIISSMLNVSLIGKLLLCKLIGGEYEKLNGLFQKVGITHRVSCPHAHQQNGSAKRKHHHIVEVGLALLANASMPGMKLFSLPLFS
jgi:hypothetical protein